LGKSGAASAVGIASRAGAAALLEEKRAIYMLGNGGHARVLAATLRALGLQCAGYFSLERGADSDLPWLGPDENLSTLDPSRAYLLNGVGSVGNISRRRSVFERGKASHFTFLTLVHPTAIVETDARLDEGVQVLAGAILQTGICVGANSIVNTGSIIDHDTHISAHCHIAPGARLSGGVRLGENSHVGVGATIIQQIQIGEGAVIGAGSVVLSDVLQATRVAGVPARPLSG
jgi:UDP-perosamine 4-acetyltransferase